MINNKSDLSIYKNVICDSSIVLDYCYKDGLNKKATVYTSSPYLYHHINGNNIKNIENICIPEQICQFRNSYIEIAQSIHTLLKNNSNYTREEILCIVYTVVMHQKISYRASCINDSILNHKTLFIKCKSSERNKSMINPPWDKIISPFDNFNVIEYKIGDELDKTNVNISNKNETNLLPKLYLGGWDTAFYRLAIKVCRIIPQMSCKRQLLLAGENELTIETAARLALKGMSLIQLKLPKISNNQKPTLGIPPALPKEFEDIIYENLNRWLDKKSFLNYIGLLEKEIQLALLDFHKYKIKWDNTIGKHKHKNNILITNSPVNPEGLALTEICKKYNIPVIAAQHGVTPEISKSHQEHNNFVYEINNADISLVFNKEGAKLHDKSPFAYGKSYISGMPNRYFRMHRINKFGNSPPLLYMQTVLYRGNINLKVHTFSDIDLAEVEINVIKKIISRLPYKVRYKTYPKDSGYRIRYFDLDPMIECALNYKNIELYNNNVDARYLFANARVIIMSRSTSSLGWAVMSEKPLVLIDRKDDICLTSKAKDIMSEGIFLFSAESSTFNEDIVSFLSKPIDEIENIWDKKSIARQKMINSLFSAYKGGAGKRAAEFIKERYFN